jgi:hypothetical protein
MNIVSAELEAGQREVEVPVLFIDEIALIMTACRTVAVYALGFQKSNCIRQFDRFQHASLSTVASK